MELVFIASSATSGLNHSELSDIVSVALTSERHVKVNIQWLSEYRVQIVSVLVIVLERINIIYIHLPVMLIIFHFKLLLIRMVRAMWLSSCCLSLVQITIEWAFIGYNCYSVVQLLNWLWITKILLEVKTRQKCGIFEWY